MSQGSTWIRRAFAPAMISIAVILAVVAPAARAENAEESTDKPRTPTVAIDEDLLPIRANVQNMKMKLSVGIVGSGEAKRRDEGWAFGTFDRNVRTIDTHVGRALKTGERLLGMYQRRGEDRGAHLAELYAQNLENVRLGLTEFSAARDAATAKRAFERLHHVVLRLIRTRRDLEQCCDDLVLPAPAS